jgi:hypothetical protein
MEIRMTLSRRGLLRVLTGIIAAPAVIQVDALMRVVKVPPSQTIGGFYTTYDTIYSNRIIRHHIDVEAIRDRNVLLSLDEYGLPVYKLMFEELNLTYSK